MNSGFIILMLAATIAAALGFRLLTGFAADAMQAVFFALLVSSLASLVFSRRRPV
jgi:uncharacterized membrane protein YtjA (UPF0391 family)